MTIDEALQEISLCDRPANCRIDHVEILLQQVREFTLHAILPGMTVYPDDHQRWACDLLGIDPEASHQVRRAAALVLQGKAKALANRKRT